MRGCERRVYYVKNADSPLFEEAVFVLRRPRRGRPVGTPRPSSLAEEAERIIRESGPRLRALTRPAPIRRLSPPAAFMLGAGTTSVFIGAAAALVRILL